ncbi:MAG: anthranilate phosphoribosyltransferase, partial [Ktedonobacterales bacterium]
LSLSAPTRICEVDGKTHDLREYTITPESVGLAGHMRAEVLGGDATENAAIMRELLAGKRDDAIADMVALNAGAGLYVTGRSDDLADGVRQAREALRDGRATATLDALVVTTGAFAPVIA